MRFLGTNKTAYSPQKLIFVIAIYSIGACVLRAHYVQQLISKIVLILYLRLLRSIDTYLLCLQLSINQLRMNSL